ncbi:MAG: hypothetical protein COB82_03010 [Marinobacter sp.]|jgi:hypothetical protein|nr:MAG: hypothetical protein COB82_03010 [Marinobacter sp.]
MGVNLTLFTVDNQCTREPLRVLIPLDDAVYGSLENSAPDDQISDRRFTAFNVDLSPERGLVLELSCGEMTFTPENWRHAWQALNLEQRVYRCREITQRLILDLLFFRPEGKHGQRGAGRTDKEVIEYLVNLVHAYRLFMEDEKDEPTPVPLREATNAVALDAETQDPRFLFLMPDDGSIPWPASWNADGATPGTDQGIERLRKRAARGKPKGY